MSDTEACVICYQNPKNTVFYKCGHKCVCSECADQFKKFYEDKCPICRQKVLDVIRQYD